MQLIVLSISHATVMPCSAVVRPFVQDMPAQNMNLLLAKQLQRFNNAIAYSERFDITHGKCLHASLYLLTIGTT